MRGPPASAPLLGRRGIPWICSFISDKDALFEVIAQPAVGTTARRACRASSIIQQAKPEPAADLGSGQGSESCPIAALPDSLRSPCVGKLCLPGQGEILSPQVFCCSNRGKGEKGLIHWFALVPHALSLSQQRKETREPMWPLPKH